MRRRDLLGLLGSAAATPFSWPLAAHAQQAAVPVVGYLSSTGEAADTGRLAAIHEALRGQGFVIDKTIAFTYRRSSGDYSRLPQLSADLVAEKVTVIATSGLPAALAAKAATSTIPIVLSLAIDPVAFGLVQSFNRPGGNVTGVTTLFDP